MRPWQPVVQGLHWLRAGTLLALISTTLFVLLTGSLLGYIINPVQHLITVGIFVALAGTARLALFSPSGMSGKKLLLAALSAQVLDYILARWGPYYYGQSFFSAAALCHYAQQGVGLVAFFGMLLGLRALAVQVERKDLALGFVSLAVVPVASWILLWLVGKFNVGLAFEHIYALLACTAGYVFVYTVFLKKLAGAVEDHAIK